MCKKDITIVDGQDLLGRALALADKADAFAKELLQEQGTVIEDDRGWHEHYIEKALGGMKKSELVQVSPLLPLCHFKAGDKVTFTNAAGVEFKGRTILGFSELTKWGQCIHLDTESWWVPHSPEEIKLEQGATKIVCPDCANSDALLESSGLVYCVYC